MEDADLPLEVCTLCFFFKFVKKNLLPKGLLLLSHHQLVTNYLAKKRLYGIDVINKKFLGERTTGAKIQMRQLIRRLQDDRSIGFNLIQSNGLTDAKNRTNKFENLWLTIITVLARDWISWSLWQSISATFQSLSQLLQLYKLLQLFPHLQLFATLANLVQEVNMSSRCRSVSLNIFTPGLLVKFFTSSFWGHFPRRRLVTKL